MTQHSAIKIDDQTRVCAPSGFGWALKMVVDWCVALLFALLFLPLILAISVLVKLDSKGPIFFRQPRFGKDGKPFAIYKFRTMYTDLSDLSGGQQTAQNDPRITRVGMVLRKSSLDELPQVFNVLLGDMALNGPRAHPCGMRVEGKLCEEIDPRYHLRHAVRPGISGWAQVNGSRGPVDDAAQLLRRVDLDIEYVTDWSWKKERSVYGRTFGVVRKAAGAR